MRLHSVTLLQDPKKAELVSHFYSEILGLPHEKKLDSGTLRWFEESVFLATRAANPDSKAWMAL